MEMTFGEYLKRRRITDTPAGDFVRDVLRDRGFPMRAVTWPEVSDYLCRKNATSEAAVAARSVWRGYRSGLRRSTSGIISLTIGNKCGGAT